MNKSCLIIKNDGIGDLVMVSGIISNIASFFPDGVDLVTCIQNKFIAEHIEGVRKIYFVSRDDLTYQSFRGANKLGIFLPKISTTDKAVLKSLKRKEYTVAICLRRFIRQSSLIIMKYVVAKNKYCAWQYPTNATEKMAINGSKGWEHYKGNYRTVNELNYYKEFLTNCLQLRVDITPALLYGNTNKQAPSFPNNAGIFIGGSSSRWPASYWFDIIEKLHEDGWAITLFASKGEELLAETILKHCPYCVNKTGNKSLDEFSNEFYRLTAFIGNDSGISHLASLFIKNVLIILGGGTFKRFLPWPVKNAQKIVYYALDCFDCNWKCIHQDRYCLQFVSPKKVYDAFIAMNSGTEINSNINTSIKSYSILMPKENMDDYSKTF